RLNERALIGNDLKLEVGANGVDCRHLLTNALGHLHGIRARLFADAHAYRRQPAELYVAPEIAIAELDVGDVLHADRVAVDERDDRGRDLVHARIFAERAHVKVPQAVTNVAGRSIEVLAAD